MTNDERESVFKFTDSIINHLHYVSEAQKAIKEQFGLDSEYDDDNLTLTIKTTSISESLQAAQAKELVSSMIDPNILTVLYSA